MSSSPEPSTSGLLPVDRGILHDVVQNLTISTLADGRSRKRSSVGEGPGGDENGSTDTYTSYGWAFCRQADIFIHVDAMVVEGIKKETEDTDDERQLSDKERHTRQGWETLCQIIPNFRTQMLGLTDQRCLRKKVCQQINESRDGTRGDDTSALKGCIIDYLLVDTVASQALGIKRKGLKGDRGWMHPVTAELLSPIKYPATQETYNDLNRGGKNARAGDFPRFLYPDGHIYNPDDIETGILQGHLMLRVAKHILQGPTAALAGAGFHRGRGGNASLMNLSGVTPNVIAYIAVQTRFALSSQSMWGKRDGLFDYQEFYWRIVSLFDDDEGQDIIALYNYHVFGNPPPASASALANSELEPITEESDYDKLKEQRAAKRARQATR
ncbi:hypothetical protein NLJ89_g3879 [Agrocybe chaxingu]|uniref:Uncharacterized protein n=1 Tax=Agrocybe chaxingu TaxID=84603 RepID=A0A9W8K4X9_9AGAR|nr:hypothetical protein NLJ89_g3879 [Agrocybe chaxingu]